MFFQNELQNVIIIYRCSIELVLCIKHEILLIQLSISTMATIIKRLCRRNSINVFNYLNSKTIKSSRYVCSLYCGGRCIAPSTNMFIRNYSKECKKLPQTETPEKKSLVKRFKEMYRDYWYVLIPVHVITSVAWFGGFYYVARR